MYTRLHLDVELKKDTPNEVLAYLSGRTPLAHGGRLAWLPSARSAMFTTAPTVVDWLEYNGEPVLHLDCSLKNYKDEIAQFLAYLTPFVNESRDEFVGFTQYEEAERPTLIFWRSGNFALEWPSTYYPEA